MQKLDGRSATVIATSKRSGFDIRETIIYLTNKEEIMNLDFLTNYAVPIVVGVCLCVGYILKNVVPNEKVNRFIPLIMGVLGVTLNAWINLNFTPEILLGGLLSGLSSTGLYEAFKNLINKED